MAGNRRRQRLRPVGTGGAHSRRPAPLRGAAPAAAAGAPAASRDAWICLALAAGAFLLYAPSFDNAFVALDDPFYVTANPTVQRGLTAEGLRWAFTTTTFANWLPVTWLSHMLDCELFGLDPAGHHATSAALHAINAALVYLLLARTTGARARAAAVAALFAAHPLRVESVAWVSERKDVLCGTFFLLTLLAYAAYCRRPRPGAYVLMAAAYALGLMSKTMIVTLPAVLLLVDYWPLRRLRVGAAAADAGAAEGGAPGARSADAGAGAAARGVGSNPRAYANGDDPASEASPTAPVFPPRPLKWLLLEKLPLAVMAAAASAWTMVLQREGLALAGGAHLTLGQRAANAVVSAVRYLGMTVRPVELSVLYPHPGTWPAWKVAGAAVVLLAASAAAVAVWRRRPYLPVGWFWFLGMLVPVSGIVQAGDQALADRYTYLPSIGLLTAAVWGIADLSRREPRLRRALRPALAVVLVILAAATVFQQRHWHSTAELAGHAVEVDPDNWAARGLLASQLMQAGETEAALEHFLLAARGMRAAGRAADAIETSRLLAARFPTRAAPRVELGAALAAAGRAAEADQAFAEAQRLAPGDPAVPAEWGRALLESGRRDEAAARLREALRLAPADPALRRRVESDLRRAEAR